jgi:protein-disulfide isomerase
MQSKENTQRNAQLMNNPDVETHYMLFENQGALDDIDIVQFAATLGLDTSRVIKKVLAGRHTARAREDFRSGARGGVNGTPTLFINGVAYEGSPDSPLAAIVELGS